jgi:hypothetical protein
MRLIDADALKKDLTRFYDNEVTARELIDEQPTIEAETDNGWISVDDRLPDKNQKILAFYKALGEENRIHNDLIATNWRKSNGDFIPTAGYKVTHWMPLPEPPKEDKDG